MDPVATLGRVVSDSGTVSLGSLAPGAVASVVSVGTLPGAATVFERRLVELGFVNGERVEVLAQARPGGDPFIVRVGDTTFALRRREVENLWVAIAPAWTTP